MGARRKKNTSAHEDIRNRYRVNEEIRAREVRLVGENVPQPGIYPLKEALRIAREKGLDLVEVAPNADPPVCRILDFHRFIYEKKKKERELKKKATRSELKEIRLTPQTDEHDIQFKLRYIRDFLQEGHKVRVYVFFRGRQILFRDQGKAILDRIIQETEDLAQVEQPPRMEGNRYIMILAPSRSKKKNPSSPPLSSESSSSSSSS